MKNFFKPEDFGGSYGTSYTSRLDTIGAAEVANEKLNKLIESWPVVYEVVNSAGIKSWLHINAVSATSKALLAFIEEISPEPCKHEPLDIRIELPNRLFLHPDIIIQPPTRTLCKHCGVELVATWEAKK